MHLFPREQKYDSQTQQPIPDAYFFGHFDANPRPPFSVSFASFDEHFKGEKRHYHSTSEKVYVIIQGKGVLEVDGQQVDMTPEHMIHIQPGEIHCVKSVVQSPLQFLAVTSQKIDDKVVLND